MWSQAKESQQALQAGGNNEWILPGASRKKLCQLTPLS